MSSVRLSRLSLLLTQDLTWRRAIDIEAVIAAAKLLTVKLDFAHRDGGAMRRHPDAQSRAEDCA
jgi:hypothetical protein